MRLISTQSKVQVVSLASVRAVPQEADVAAEVVERRTPCQSSAAHEWAESLLWGNWETCARQRHELLVSAGCKLLGRRILEDLQ